METEIEAKFLAVNHDAMRSKLMNLGANCTQPIRLMRRKIFDFSDNRLNKEHNGWIRVRDEGDKITLSYKQLNNRTLQGTKEVTVTVHDFDTMCLFLEQLGLEAKSYQETKRESWELNGAQIELDEWPWVKPYMEIEAPSEEIVQSVVDKLGIAMADAVYGSVEIAYQAEYDVTDEDIDALKTITFGDVPASLKARKK